MTTLPTLQLRLHGGGKEKSEVFFNFFPSLFFPTQRGRCAGGRARGGRGVDGSVRGEGVCPWPILQESQVAAPAMTNDERPKHEGNPKHETGIAAQTDSGYVLISFPNSIAPTAVYCASREPPPFRDVRISGFFRASVFAPTRCAVGASPRQVGIWVLRH